MDCFDKIESFYLLVKWSHIMPTASETIFILLKEKKYDEVLRRIESDETLVSAVNERKRSLLYMILSFHNQPRPEGLIQFLLMSQKLDFAYGVGFPNISLMIHTYDLAIFKCAIRNPNFLVQLKTLPYEGAKRCESALMRRAQSEDGLLASNSPESIEFRDKLEKIQKIVSLLRDATILHALRTDDRGLMEELDRLGANPTSPLGPLGNNKLPGTLTTPSNVNINAWFDDRVAAILAQQEAKRQVAAPLSYHEREIAAAKAKLVDLERWRLDARKAATSRHVEAFVGTSPSDASNPHNLFSGNVGSPPGEQEKSNCCCVTM